MIRHLLAYGQSDQASFRDTDVAGTYDVMTVPGTIAAYFHEATAAFVLTIRKPYLIDPRTPLFQDQLNSVRASHLSLADWHGPTVRQELETTRSFRAAFYSDAVVREVVREVIDRQRAYDNTAAAVAPKIDRYKRLLARARGEDEAVVTGSGGTAVNPPVRVLAPYFAVNSETSPWWTVMQQVWAHCATLSDPHEISPVLCVGRPSDSPPNTAVTLLDDLLRQRPTALSPEVFFWVTGLQERRADKATLRTLWTVVQNHSQSGLRLTNMYGGFFSICLGHAGLVAFNNGLGYSESRDWPALDATGAAPARYYIPRMHIFAPPATADLLIDRQPAFRCSCGICEQVHASGRSIVSMDYPELKGHFALTRAWEVDLATSRSPGDIAAHLRGSHATYQATPLPTGVRIDNAHLVTWAEVLEAV